jgi:hypothetical protein
MTVPFLTALVIAAAAATAGCAGSGGIPKAPAQPKQQTELLDWKNAALGTPVPEWVMASAESDLRIQKLSEYKDQYCFVVTREDVNKDRATQWVENTANGAAEVSRILSTTVNNLAEAQEVMKDGDERVKQNTSQLRDAMSNASFKGFRRASDFWTLSRNKASKREYYTGYSLWIIGQKDLNEQTAAFIQNHIDNNKAMSQAERSIYLDIIKDIRARGVLQN